MGFLDKAKSQMQAGIQKAQEAGRAGQAKLDNVQAKRKADAMLRDLGALVYAEHTGRSTAEDSAKIEQLFTELASHEAEHGQVALAPEAAQSFGADSVPTAGTAPAAGTYTPMATAEPFVPTATAEPFVPTAAEALAGGSFIPTAEPSEPQE
ncbi:MAG TPA: hypothetical protein VGS21_02090 [Acidimicrobiales bacterium]|nr:hypothetical protein [Acidimicrobiales bacterium]